MGFVKLVSGQAGSTDGLVATLSGLNTIGCDLFVVAVADYNHAGHVGVFSTPSTTWVELGNIATAPGVQITLWYAKNPITNASQIFQVIQDDNSRQSYPGLAMFGFSGSDLTAPFDGQETGALGGSLSGQPGSLTPAEDNALIIAAMTTESDPGAVTINAGFSSPPIGGVNPSALNYQAYISYLIQTSAAAVNPTWSWANGAANAMRIASFKPSIGGGPPAPKIGSMLAMWQ